MFTLYYYRADDKILIPFRQERLNPLVQIILGEILTKMIWSKPNKKKKKVIFCDGFKTAIRQTFHSLEEKEHLKILWLEDY